MTKLRWFLLGCLVMVTGAAFADAFKDSNGNVKVTSYSDPLPAGIYPKWGSDVSVTCNSGSSTKSSQLAVGRYVVTCGVTAFGDQGDTNVSATMTTERRIPSGFVYPVRVDDTTTDGFVALICTASTTCVISADS